MTRSLFITALLTLCFVNCFSQRNEFTVYENGLIYSDTTIAQLNKIVDSLNLTYKTCDLTREFISRKQAKGHFISLNGVDLQQAKQDLDNNISYDDFVKKYPNSLVNKDLLILKRKYTNYHKKKTIEFYTLPLGTAYNKNEHSVSFEDSVALYYQSFQNKWLVNFYEGNKWYPEQAIYAFYITQDFTSAPLKEEYAKLIQYVDCIIDTTATIFNRKRKSSKKTIVEIDSLLAYINRRSNIPVKFMNKRRIPHKLKREHDRYLASRDSLIEEVLIKEHDFNILLNRAVDKAIEKHISHPDLEILAEKYVSKEKALQLRRNRNVIGRCSGDLKPRQHMMKIATLAAETQNWNVFIRAHLNIMNDRFSRMSDNSRSARMRSTYLKELEQLNINVVDLLLGMCFQIENPSKNHYFGSVSKVGKALIASNHSEYIENKLVSIINDEDLDEHNRIFFYFIYDWYAHSIKDEERKQHNLKRLSECVNKLPSHIKDRLTAENYQFEQLLVDEIDLLKQHFNLSETCINGCNHDYPDKKSPNSWSADLHDKKHPENVMTNIIIGFEDKPMSLKPFLKAKDSYFRKVQSVSFIFDTILKTPQYSIDMWYVNGKTMPLLAQEKFLENKPEQLKKKYTMMLDKAILFEYHKPSSISNWLYFPNGEIMLWDYMFDIPIKGYEEKQLVSDNRAYSGYAPRMCYKLFDKSGNMIE